MLFCRNNVIILLILLLVAISTSLIIISPTNIMEGNSPDACIMDSEGLCTDVNGKKCKQLSPIGTCLTTDDSNVNKLNNSISSFYDNIDKINSFHSIQTNKINNDYDENDDDELYILKSQIIPPVCPMCPTSPPCKNKIKKKCQPCPPCAKCPEPSFDCKKVPNYSSTRNAYLPRAILTDEFTQYGM